MCFKFSDGSRSPESGNYKFLPTKEVEIAGDIEAAKIIFCTCTDSDGTFLYWLQMFSKKEEKIVEIKDCRDLKRFHDKTIEMRL